jgi:hypothetical protein
MDPHGGRRTGGGRKEGTLDGSTIDNVLRQLYGLLCWKDGMVGPLEAAVETNYSISMKDEKLDPVASSSLDSFSFLVTRI